MTRRFLLQAAHLLFLISAVAFTVTGEKALAASIDSTGSSDALVLGEAANLEFPGAPGIFYSTGDLPLYFGAPSGDLTFAPGLFLSTGNTFYNYVGDTEFAVYGSAFTTAGTSQISQTPEPGSLWLLSAGLLATSLWFKTRS